MIQNMNNPIVPVPMYNALEPKEIKIPNLKDASLYSKRMDLKRNL